MLLLQITVYRYDTFYVDHFSHLTLVVFVVAEQSFENCGNE